MKKLWLKLFPKISKKDLRLRQEQELHLNKGGCIFCVGVEKAIERGDIDTAMTLAMGAWLGGSRCRVGPIPPTKLEDICK